MANVSLWDIEPTRISKDLKGKYLLLYSLPKVGKTTFIAKIPRTLILSTEPGTNALNNAIVKSITSWSDFMSAIRQLKDARAIAKFDNVAIDTIDLLWDICVKYICDREDVQSIGDLAWGKGYELARTEFTQALREIAFLQYGMIFVSHSTEKTFKNEKGEDYIKIVPALPSRPYEIINKMVDIIAYGHDFTDANGERYAKLFLRGNDRYLAGSRFKFTPNSIPFEYQALTNAICDAIDKQNAEDGIASSNEPETIGNSYFNPNNTQTFDEVMAEARTLWNKIKEVDIEKLKIVNNSIERIFGKPMKLSEATENQLDLLKMVVDEMREMGV